MFWPLLRKTAEAGRGDRAGRYGGVACVMGVMLASVSQVATGAMVPVQIKVSVLAPPCIINNNQPIEVKFGDVMTTRVDGYNYSVPVKYTLSCDTKSTKAFRMRIMGSPAFDNTALKTDKTGLGIALSVKGGKRLAVNNWLAFTYPSQPELQAVLIKDRDVALIGGKFSASATMNVDYQ